MADLTTVTLLPVVCDLFAVHLELETAPPDTDFFLAGGDSLSALELAVAVEQAVGGAVAVRDIFECPTPASLAGRLCARGDGRAHHSAADDQPPHDTGVGAETRALWLERQRGEVATGAYNVPCLLSISGELDVDRLRAALDEVQARHPALRTVFAEHRGLPHAVVRTSPGPLTVMPAGADAEAVIRAEVDAPFDLSEGPLFRATLLRGDAGPALLMVADHLICDGTGLRILASDLVSAYRDPGSVAARPPVPPDAGSAGAEVRAAVDHWREVLTPAPEPLALPVSRPRSAPVGETGIVSRELPSRTEQGLRAAARAAHTGLFAPVAAAVAHALSEVTGSADICVGTAVDRRARVGRSDAVGFHVATVPLRIAAPRGEQPAALLGTVAKVTMDAIDHSAASFAEIVAAVAQPRLPFRAPLFDLFVAVFPHIDTGASDGIRLRGGPVPLRRGIAELSFLFVEHADGVRLLVQFDVLRYHRATVSNLADRVVRAAAQVAEPDPPQNAAVPSTPVFRGFRFT